MTAQIPAPKGRVRTAALLAAGMLTGSMFGPAVADAARRVIADDLNCTAPCVQDNEISGVAASKITGKVANADTLDGHDATAFPVKVYSGDHDLNFGLGIPDDVCLTRTLTPSVALEPTDHILVQPPDNYLPVQATATVTYLGDIRVVVCSATTGDDAPASGTYRITALR